MIRFDLHLLVRETMKKQRYGEAKLLWSVGLHRKKYIVLLSPSHWYSADFLWAFRPNHLKIPAVIAF